MRDHGVDMPDPDTPAAVAVRVTISGGPNSNMDAAMEACKDKLPNGGTPPSLNPQQQEQLREFAQCMRDHGVDMPDPDPNSGALRITQSGAGAGPRSGRPDLQGGAGGVPGQAARRERRHRDQRRRRRRQRPRLRLSGVDSEAGRCSVPAPGVLLIAAGTARRSGSAGAMPAPAATSDLPPATATVTRATLTQTEQVSGTLGYGDGPRSARGAPVP